MTAESKVRVAALQMEPRVGEKTRNVERSRKLLDEAASVGATLAVLPELCNSGYVFESREEAFALAEPVPGGPTCEAWQEIASRRRMHIVAGIAERHGDA